MECPSSVENNTIWNRCGPRRARCAMPVQVRGPDPVVVDLVEILLDLLRAPSAAAPELGQAQFADLARLSTARRRDGRGRRSPSRPPVPRFGIPAGIKAAGQ